MEKTTIPVLQILLLLRVRETTETTIQEAGLEVQS